MRHNTISIKSKLTSPRTILPSGSVCLIRPRGIVEGLFSLCGRNCITGRFSERCVQQRSWSGRVLHRTLPACHYFSSGRAGEGQECVL